MRSQQNNSLCFDYGHRHVGQVVAEEHISDYLLDKLGIAALVAVDGDALMLSVRTQQSATAVMRLLGYSHEYFLYHAAGTFSFQIAVNMRCKHDLGGRLRDT